LRLRALNVACPISVAGRLTAIAWMQASRLGGFSVRIPDASDDEEGDHHEG
jgi:hypothetical protein